MNYGPSGAGSKDINCPRLQIHCTARKQVTRRSNKIGGGAGLYETECFTSVAIIVLLHTALVIVAFICGALGIEPGLLNLNLLNSPLISKEETATLS